ncbi:MAG: hydrogenase 3 maturation endopeptidase HyCI [Candidatus Aminicenantes bacterium]|nr:hydrogenase 3 maturation endopeptidase HyCI [Candidatus Aminicenantes bacterium]
MNRPAPKKSRLPTQEPGWRTLLRREVGTASRLVVLGVGNEERGDDAAGVLGLRLLRKSAPHPMRRNVFYLEGGVAPENVTGKIRAFAPSHVLILDAVLGGRKPGAIFPVKPEKIAEEELTTHRLPLSFLMRYLKESIGCRVLCLGIEPFVLEAGSAVSRPVALAIRTLARECASLLGQRRPSARPQRKKTRAKSDPKKRRRS